MNLENKMAWPRHPPKKEAKEERASVGRGVPRRGSLCLPGLSFLRQDLTAHEHSKRAAANPEQRPNLHTSDKPRELLGVCFILPLQPGGDTNVESTNCLTG